MTNRFLLEDYLQQFDTELCTTYKNSDALRTEEYQAAVKIQAWFRGIRTRAYLKNLNAHTILIQKTWRGFLGRREYRRVLAEAVIRLRVVVYHRCATKIQSAWRGYLTRKYKFNFYARKVYLTALQEMGKYIREQLSEFESANQEKMETQIKENTKDRLWQWAKANHHRVSTFCLPGIYNTPRNYMQDPREHMLRAAGKLLAEESLPINAKWKGIKLITAETSTHLEPDSNSTITPLKSIGATKVKGPFRDPAEVCQWKQTPVSLSLRVMTDYFALEKARSAAAGEEWTKRLHDEPFHAGLVSSPRYQRQHMTTSTYGPVAYGTKHFRIYEDQEVETDDKQQRPRFHTVLPPIPVFDRYNREYIRGYVET